MSKIVGYRFSFVWDKFAVLKQFGKVSADSLEEAKSLVLKYLRSEKNPNRDSVVHLNDEEILLRIEIHEFERTKEVYDCFTENAGE
ncbi:MAG: hypothetical protein AAB885_00950 [Patescibacteria group bacterium]